MTFWLQWQAVDDPRTVLMDDFPTEAAAVAHAAELVRRGVRRTVIFETQETT